MNKADDLSPLRAIEICWEETFPDLEFLPDIAWFETGADSLKSTLFILHLEQKLGIGIPLDNLTRETTPRELAAAIEQKLHPETVEATDSGATPVFLLPGLLGDEPRLVAFRHALPANIRFRVLDLPDIERTSRELASIPLTAAILKEVIEDQQPKGPVTLAGYSVGGILAYEIASQLRASGREVAMLCLLDPFLRIRADKPLIQEGTAASPMLFARPTSPLKGGIKAQMEKLGFTFPLLFGRFESARRHLVKHARELPVETLYWRRQRLIGRLRWLARRRWRPAPIDVPALLFSSDEAEDHFDVDEWARLLPRLERVHVGGTHLGLFEAAPMAEITPAIVRRIET